MLKGMAGISEGVFSDEFEIEDAVIPIVVLFINLVHSHGWSQKLVPLGSAKADIFLLSPLEAHAMHQSIDLDVRLHHQSLVSPESHLDPLDYHHSLTATQFLAALRSIVVEGVLTV